MHTLITHIKSLTIQHTSTSTHTPRCTKQNAISDQAFQSGVFDQMCDKKMFAISVLHWLKFVHLVGWSLRDTSIASAWVEWLHRGGMRRNKFCDHQPARLQSAQGKCGSEDLEMCLRGWIYELMLRGNGFSSATMSTQINVIHFRLFLNRFIWINRH